MGHRVSLFRNSQHGILNPKCYLLQAVFALTPCFIRPILPDGFPDFEFKKGKNRRGRIFQQKLQNKGGASNDPAFIFSHLNGVLCCA
jgi:hypothetical protein